MDRFNDRVGFRSQEAVDQVRTGDWLGLDAAVALVLGPEPAEGEQRSVLIERKPNHVLLFGLGARCAANLRQAGDLRRLFSIASLLVSINIAVVNRGARVVSSFGSLARYLLLSGCSVLIPLDVVHHSGMMSPGVTRPLRRLASARSVRVRRMRKA
jgi:hypothetical protein